MLSLEALAHYRRMTPRERIEEMKELLEVAEQALRRLPPEEAGRRLAVSDRLHAESRQALLEALRRLEAQGGTAASG